MVFTTNFGQHSQTIRLFKTASNRIMMNSTGFSPSTIPHPNGLGFTFIHPESGFCNYNSHRLACLRDYKIELIPLHSPLLGESQLVSFPPLNNMLKFSGYSYLIWDQVANLRQLDNHGRIRKQTRVIFEKGYDGNWFERSNRILQLPPLPFSTANCQKRRVMI